MEHKLGIFDRVTVGTIIGAGIIEAAQQALKDADQLKAIAPALNLSGGWNYVPLALISVGALSWLLKLSTRTRSKEVEALFQVDTLPEQVTKIPEERTFVSSSVKLSTFQSLFTGRTRLEGDRLTQPYLGKWIKISGRLEDISKGFFNGININLEMPFPRYDVQIRFDEEPWFEKLETIQIGQKIAIIGKIDFITPYAFCLKDCELIPLSDAEDAIDVSPPTAVPPLAKPTRTRKRAAKNSTT
jgi:hypothetical protein